MKIRGQKVYSLKERLERLSKLDSATGCIEWKHPGSNGYGRLVVGSRSDGTRKSTGAHRAAYELYTGQPIPEGFYVCHHCDNRRCINPEHLFLGTYQDNVDDRELKGRNVPAPKGEAHHFAKLTWEKVKEIREFGKRLSHRTLARLYGVDHSVIGDVLRGQSWQAKPPLNASDKAENK